MKFPRSQLDFWALFSGEPWLFRSWRRFGLATLVLFLIPAALLLLYASTTVSRTLEQRSYRELNLLSAVFARQIADEFVSLESYVVSFASRPSLLFALQSGEPAALDPILETIVENNSKAARAVFCTTNGILVRSFKRDPAVEGQSFADRDWFRGVAARNGPYVSALYNRQAFGREEVVMIAAPVHNREGRTIGYLGVQYLLTDLSAWIEHAVSATPVTLAIAGRNGEAIWDNSRVLDRLEAATLASAKDTDLSEVRVHYLGDERFASKRYIPELGWSLYTVMERAAAVGPVAETRRAIILSFLLFAALLAGGSLVWLKTLFRYAQGFERSNKHLEYFCYSIAHNFRAPLRAIAGFADLLEETAAARMDSDERQYLRRITEGGRAMDEMIRDLLQFGRISHSEITPGRHDLQSLLASVAERFQADVEKVGGELRVQPAVGAVYADATLLELALCEILSNAVSFKDPSRPLTVSVETIPVGNCMELWVRDNGVGIERKYQDQVFELFTKLETNLAGTGVGLALARNAIERMGGTIGLESARGVGTSVWIRLPRA